MHTINRMNSRVFIRDLSSILSISSILVAKPWGEVLYLLYSIFAEEGISQKKSSKLYRFRLDVLQGRSNLSDTEAPKFRHFKAPEILTLVLLI